MAVQILAFLCCALAAAREPADCQHSEMDSLSLMQVNLELVTKVPTQTQSAVDTARSLGLPTCQDAAEYKALMLSNIQEEPLLRGPAPHLGKGVSPVGPPNATDGVVFFTAHKTGHDLVWQMWWIMQPHFGAKTMLGSYSDAYMEKIGVATPWDGNDDGCTLRMDGKCWWHTDSMSAAIDEHNARKVFFYRDPIKYLLSAYRYHVKNNEPEWENKTSKCGSNSESDCELLFSTCCHQCSYYALLSNSSEHDGILLEAVHSRAVLDALRTGLDRWMNDANVLTLSVEHFAKDFNGTLSCMLKFLNFSGDESSVLGDMQEANVKNPSFQGMKGHTTHGHYNNSQLEALLQNHAIWGQQLALMRSVQKKIDERQWQQYGCPQISL